MMTLGQPRPILRQGKIFNPRGVSAPCPRAIHMYITIFSNLFFSETAWPINAKHVEPFWEGDTKVYINGPGHMTKMAAMLIYGKNL